MKDVFQRFFFSPVTIVLKPLAAVTALTITRSGIPAGSYSERIAAYERPLM